MVMPNGMLDVFTAVMIISNRRFVCVQLKFKMYNFCASIYMPSKIYTYMKSKRGLNTSQLMGFNFILCPIYSNKIQKTRYKGYLIVIQRLFSMFFYGIYVEDAHSNCLDEAYI